MLLLVGRMAEVNRRTDLAVKAYEQFLADGHDDQHVRLFMAERALRSGSDSAKAVEHLEAAKRCFPRHIGRDSPYLQLARLYRGEGDMDKAMAQLDAFAAIAAEHYGVRKELKTWYRSKKDHAKVVKLCEEMVDISPYGANVARREPPDMELHRHYAEALIALGRMDEAVRERRVQVALGRLIPEEGKVQAGVVKDHVELGNMLLDRNDAAGAMTEALAALRLSPQDASAHMLKRRAQEAGGNR